MENNNCGNEFWADVLRALLKNSSDMIFIKNKDLVYLNASFSFAKLVGLDSPSQLTGKTDYDIFSKELADKYRKDDKQVLLSDSCIIDMLEALPEENGQKRFSSTSKFPITDKNGNVVGIYGIGRDITVNMMLEEEIERREQTNRVFDDVLEVDLTNNVVLNADGGVFADIVKTIINQPFDAAVITVANDYIHPNYKEEFLEHFSRERLNDAYNNGIRSFSVVTYMKINSSYKWLEFTDRIYFSKLTNTLRLASYVRDMNDDIKYRENLRRIAATDSLTGLLNRKTLIENITECLQRGGKTKNMLFSS